MCRAGLLLGVALASCAPAPGPAAGPAASPGVSAARGDARAAVARLADEVVEAYAERYPDVGLLAGRPDRYPDRLTDASAGALRAWEAREDAWARRLAEVDAAALRGTPEEVTLGFVRELVEPARALRVCRRELWRVSQMDGWQVTYARVAEVQPVGSPAARAAALRRWGGIPALADAEVAALREGVRLGYTAPRRNVQLVIEQIDGLLAADTASPFLSPARRDSSPEFRAAWAALVRDAVGPALRRYRDYLRGEYLAAAREAIGVSANPDGAACYRAALRAETTVDRSPEEVFALARREVERREEELRRVAKSVTGSDDLAAFARWMDESARNRVGSREEVMALTEAAIARAEAALPRWFGIVPRARVRVEPFPAMLEETGSEGQYLPPAEDGSRPGTYLVNLGHPERRRRGPLEVTAFHEALPGHHLQLGIAQERPGLHPVAGLVSNAGFTEGWARYAESLADEMGLYGGEVERLSQLSGLPTVMVVDPGIHAMGWTRRQAVEYLHAKHPTVPVERLEAGVDRMAVWPAQAVTYQLGALEILALREEARRALGARFDVRAFHDRVLGDGTITLPMLRERVRRWIAEAR